MAVTEELMEVEASNEVYGEFLRQVEFQCTLCEAVLEDITQLNSKITRLYKLIVDKSKTERSHKSRIGTWKAGFLVASEIRHAACLKKNLHPICGIDLSTIEEVHHAIKERLEFLLGFEIKNCE
jgi:hypothetical protein